MKHLLYILMLSSLFVFSANAADYYWIGGAGNWSDISHWATTSGGVITHSQVPTADDDVYFDANSFTAPGQVVVINNDNIFCRNLDWSAATNMPVFQGDVARVINVFGELTFIEAMTFDFAGEMRFRSPLPDAAIELAGHQLGSMVFFIGDGGWILQDSIVVDSLITLEDGDLNTNGHNLHADYFRVNIQSAGSLTLGASKVTLNGENRYFQIGQNLFAYWVMEITAINVPFTVDPGTSQFEFTQGEVGVEFRNTTAIDFSDLYFSSPTGLGALILSNEPVAFGEVRYNNDGSFSWTYSADHLILSAGHTYSFISGATYPIEQITAVGDCLGTITIEGSENNGQQATIESNGQAINLDYVNLKNLNTSGSSAFTADNSADLGNNTGWTIIPRSVQDLYWVGDSGNWNDPMHWSLTSGGPGGACIPSGTDNVFFDANSFSMPGQSVTIDVANAYCRDMTWTGVGFIPSFAGDFDPILHIFGSLTMVEEMTYSFGGRLSFESREAGKTITTGNHPVDKVEFIGTDGEWTLQDTFWVHTYISLSAGTLITNDQFVSSTEFTAGQPANFRRLELGNSTWVIRHFPDANFDLWNVDCGDGTTYEVDAGTSTIDFQAVGGYFQHYASQGTTLEYNRVIFNNEVGHLDNFNTPAAITIDSLVFNHGGYFLDDFTVNTLILSPGYTYLIEAGNTQTIGNIVAPANCNALIAIRADANTANLNVLNDHPNLQYLTLQGLNSVGPGMLTAQNSIDLGGNTGWTITELGNRTLYWVGGAGDWSDPAHWSASSGGPGGECVPTLRDDVIFDGNSFTGPGQEVTGVSLNGYYCRDISWADGLPDPTFNMGRLYCHGSIVFSDDMQLQLQELFLNSAEMETITTAGQALIYVYQDGAGSYTLLDDFTALEFYLRNGSFNSNGQRMELVRWVIDNPGTIVNVTLGSSHITLTGQTDQDFFNFYPLEAVYGNNTSIDPGTSVIELTDSFAGAYLSGGLDFNNMIFSGTDGLLYICQPPGASSLNNTADFNLLEIGGDAQLKGFNNIDSLLLAPGKSYQLEFGVTQQVNEYLLVLGNNCNPIELFSTQPGLPATINSANATVVGDFIQMQDQIGSGGAAFFAGTHSTNINNSNIGWLFESSPTFVDVGFFGQDRSFCEGEVLTLSAYNYSPGETYEWSTGSDEETIDITVAGVYWAEVTFGNMCQISDTITINTITPPIADLGLDTDLCEGEDLELDASSPFSDVDYLWQDGSSDPTFTVSSGGEYFVTIDRMGCIDSDTISITDLPTPQVELGDNQTLCEGESFTLDADIGSPATYEWQDGSMNATLDITQSGTYSVMVTANGCTGTDEVLVAYNPIPVFELGPDTSLCSGESLTFDLSASGDTFEWQDGSDLSTYSVSSAGEFFVTVSALGCAASDTIDVAFFDTPQVDLGENQSLCEGDALTLDADIGSPATYEWQDGSMNPTLDITQSGNYSVLVTANGCTGSDEVLVTYNPIPVFELGPDTSLCSDQSLVFDFSGLGDTFTWQDGSAGPSYTISEAGQYSLEVSALGCSFSDAIMVSVRSAPLIDLGPDREACEGEVILLDAPTGNFDSFNWQDGSTDATLPVDISGLYWLEATLDGCSGRDSVLVDFRAMVDPGLPDSLNLCRGETLLLQPNTGGGTVVWQDGSTSLVYEVKEEGLYQVQVENGACLSEDEVLVSASSCGLINVFVPNAFSPNADGINDTFLAYFDPAYEILDYELQVFDRWGEHVFSSTNPAEAWDGTFRSQPASFGVYVYVLRFRFTDGGEQFEQLLSGDVAVVK